MTELFHRALALWEMNRLAEAVPYWRRHLAEEPDDSAAWTSLANCLHQIDRLEEATEAAEQACSVALLLTGCWPLY